MTTTADPSMHAAVSCRVELHPERDVMRVVAVGELDLTAASDLAAQLHELRDAGFERITLDLRELVLPDPTVIALILSAHASRPPTAASFP